MKTAAKVLSIISLIVGLIWATVEFVGSWFGWALSSESMHNSFPILKFIVKLIVVIAAGVFGIVGSDKELLRTKTLVMGALTFICGIALLPLANYIAGTLYVIAGCLLLIAGRTNTKSQ